MFADRKDSRGRGCRAPLGGTGSPHPHPGSALGSRRPGVWTGRPLGPGVNQAANWVQQGPVGSPESVPQQNVRRQASRTPRGTTLMWTRAQHMHAAGEECALGHAGRQVTLARPLPVAGAPFPHSFDGGGGQVTSEAPACTRMLLS